MQNIERASIEAVCERRVPITAANFAWNRDRGSLAEFQDPVYMEVRVGSRHTSTDWLLVCILGEG